MSDLITKYFHDTDNNENRFNLPATDEQIAILESQLKIELPNATTNSFTNPSYPFVNLKKFL